MTTTGNETDDCNCKDCCKDIPKGLIICLSFLCCLLPSVICLTIFKVELDRINREFSAVEGECMYESSTSVPCYKNEGVRSGYIYQIKNGTDAYSLCTESTFIDDSTDCQQWDQFQLNTPTDQIDEWQTCYVIDCGESVDKI